MGTKSISFPFQKPQLDAGQCAPGGGFAASGNIVVINPPDFIFMRENSAATNAAVN
jgi:hypothetical protein